MADPKITIRVEGSGLPGGGMDGGVLSQKDGKPVWIAPTTSAEVLAWLREAGFVQPAMASENVYYTDNNGAVYVL